MRRPDPRRQSPSAPRFACELARGLAGGLVLALASVAASAAGASGAAGGGSSTIKIATWNLEWFLTPATFNALKGHCTRDERTHRHQPRSIPCDVAATLERGAADLAAMARTARALDADVIALQEVDGPEAARQVFGAYDFCFTGGETVQNTGFAVRRGLPHRCAPDLVPLALGGALRRGAVLLLYPGSARELTLLAVHLKSGCARAPLDSPERACRELAGQAEALRAWLAEQQQGQRRYAVLGDFNRELLAERDDGLWARIGADTQQFGLFNTASGAAFRNCHIGQMHSGYIDYILLSRSLAPALVHGSFERSGYAAADAWRYKLSDHCPVAIRLRLD